MKRVLYSLAAVALLNAEYQSATVLSGYQTYLEEGTYQGAGDLSGLKKKPASRYETFKIAFEHFEQIQGKVIVELGTSRSFVHGGLPGCNSDNVRYWKPHEPAGWDWGAGFFTYVAADCLQQTIPTLHTVDIASEHIHRCKIMTAPFAHFINYHVCSSVDFLKSFPPGQKIDLLYIDTGDMTPIEPTARLQLEEAKIIVERDLISPHGMILIDDVRNQTPKAYGETSDWGKAKYSLPYFLDHGFTIIADEYQVILVKAESLS